MRSDNVRMVYDSATLPSPPIHEALELARYRHLLVNLISRDLKVRYKRSVLGFAWAMVNPLLTMLVLVLVFSQLFSRVENYPIYVIGGLIVWRFFRQGIGGGMSSVLSSSGLLTRIYIPPSIFVTSSIGGDLIHFTLAAGVVMVLTALSGLLPSLSWLLLPLTILHVALFTLGIGLMLAALAVFFVDLFDIIDVVMGAYYFLTPIIYPMSILPPTLQDWQQFNPMFYLVNNFRSILLGTPPSTSDILIATIVSIVALLVGWLVFTRLRWQFAYRV